MLLALSFVIGSLPIQLKKRGFEVRWMTRRATSARPYHTEFLSLVDVLAMCAAEGEARAKCR